jgi:hypothetical protein
MAATSTTLAAAVGANDMTIVVTSAAGFAVGNIIRVNSEWMTQTGAASGTTIPVRRGGQNGSTQVAHVILSPVVTALPSDTLNDGPSAVTNPANWEKIINSISVNTPTGTTEPSPTYNTLTFINKVAAAAIVLGNPSALVDGLEWTIFSNTTGAHTVTYTPGFHGDTGSSDIATFAATIGNSMTLIAARGVWGVKCVNGVTLA